MHAIHTHYDNLKVSRDAHPKIIREAYKKLSRQYHPDHNPNNPEATKVMQVINLAYDVLSDPVRRKEHDEWIARMEAEQMKAPPPYQYEPHFEQAQRQAFHSRGMDAPFFASASATNRSTGAKHAQGPTQGIDKKAVFEHFSNYWFWYVLTVAVSIGFGYHNYARNTYSPFMTTSHQHSTYTGTSGDKRITNATIISTPGIAPRKNQVVSQEGHYVRPTMAPDGYPWPTTASYLNGFDQANSTGMSSVAVDNTLNEADVMVKLFSLNGSKPQAVRVFYIPARAFFMAEKLAPGLYDLRYLDLQTGMLSRSEPFELQESNLSNGTRYTGISMSLKSTGGNKGKMLNLAAEDF